MVSASGNLRIRTSNVREAARPREHAARRPVQRNRDIATGRKCPDDTRRVELVIRTTVIPPRRDAVVSRARVLSDRDAHLERICEVGRRRWRLEAGQHRQSRAENTFYRYKKRFGGRLSARNEEAQRNEVLTACSILNKMTELGMPVSRAVPR